MPNSITDNPDNFPANIPYAADGEDADSASLAQSFQALGDRTAYLLKRLWGFGTITNQWISVPLNPVIETGDWAWFQGSAFTYRQQETAAAAVLVFPSLLNSMIIKEIEVRGRGRGGHASLPATPPQFEFYRQQANSSYDLIATEADGSGSVSTYEAGSTLSMTLPGGGVNTVEGEAYYIRLVGEFGANAIADGWEVFSIWARVQGND
jgi:hypothetical protein